MGPDCTPFSPERRRGGFSLLHPESVYPTMDCKCFYGSPSSPLLTSFAGKHFGNYPGFRAGGAPSFANEFWQEQGRLRATSWRAVRGYCSCAWVACHREPTGTISGPSSQFPTCSYGILDHRKSRTLCRHGSNIRSSEKRHRSAKFSECRFARGECFFKACRLRPLPGCPEEPG